MMKTPEEYRGFGCYRCDNQTKGPKGYSNLANKNKFTGKKLKLYSMILGKRAGVETGRVEKKRVGKGMVE